MEQISAPRVYAYGRGHIIYAIAPRPCSRGLRAGRLDGKRKLVLFLASLRDGGACLTLDLDPNHPLTALLLLLLSRSPRRSRTHSSARLLFTTHPRTHDIPHLFPTPVLCKAARRRLHPCDQPALRPPTTRARALSLFHRALRDQ